MTAYIESRKEYKKNHGYLTKGKKFFGKQPVNNPSVVVITDLDTREVLTWTRNARNVWRLNENEPVEHAWKKKNSIENGRQFVTSNKVQPCPNELKNNGECSERFDFEHKKFFYHFTKIVNGKSTMSNERPVCRYSLTQQDILCWEKHNKAHNDLYHHNH